MTIQEMIARQQAIVTQARNEGRGLSLSLIHISEPTRPY